MCLVKNERLGKNGVVGGNGGLSCWRKDVEEEGLWKDRLRRYRSEGGLEKGIK